MEYRQAGYFLIAARPYQLPGEPVRHLPTVSTCINASFPDEWALSWTGKSEPALQILARDYGIDAERLRAIQAWGDAAFERGDWGYPNVLMSLNSAREFYRTWLAPWPHIQDLRLLGLSLPEDQCEIALASLKPVQANQGECGLYTLLKQGLPESPGGKRLGFEILGLEIGGSLHSFYCNHLHQAYAALGLKLNQYGLLAKAADARRALEFTLAESTRAEPVPWLSFRVKEYAF
ncbi:MAG: hypothetical protein CVV27_04060 [Candidatus Melainabacteria bacterium HGW-Melainabacteria-1]|nr:MAG: hypothetical protein CVV27_04060 [Candidatus Melainabacteria bacterium HGW-Melainabacteria-1]